ncbi:MAG TPA: VacJ family lipoprotein [Burkholderiales bacterium]|nr:VacJ family lipoprotein [Burkholderiales bacterium]
MKSPALAFVFLLASGCATVQNPDPRDPYESVNRAVFSFNDGLDRAVLKPVATAYRDVLPSPLRVMVRNFFSNISDVFIGVNNVLQGKPGEGFSDWSRVLWNTTFGLAGINDVASEMGLEKHNEDFGQTFGVWGVKSGPYLVLPFFGPSDVRDGVGLGFDLYASPLLGYHNVPVRNSMAAVRVVNDRAELLEASTIVEQAALDEYAFRRDFYLQRRRSLIYDGNPPRERLPEE